MNEIDLDMFMVDPISHRLSIRVFLSDQICLVTSALITPIQVSNILFMPVLGSHLTHSSRFVLSIRLDLRNRLFRPVYNSIRVLRLGGL